MITTKDTDKIREVSIEIHHKIIKMLKERELFFFDIDCFIFSNAVINALSLTLSTILYDYSGGNKEEAKKHMKILNESVNELIEDIKQNLSRIPPNYQLSD